MTKRLYSLLLILTPIKIVHAFHKFMSVSITFAEINHEENAEEGVYLEILS